MFRFKGHEVKDAGNDYVEIILHLDPSSQWNEEFSTELSQPNAGLEVQKAAQKYVKKFFPNKKFKKIKVMAGVFLVTSILGTVLTVPGVDQVSAAEVGIIGSQLTVEEIVVGKFATVVLNGKIQNTFADVNSFNITDPTGSAAGWNVVMRATQFEDVGTGHTLPKGSLTVEPPSITALEGASDASDIIKRGGTIDTATGGSILSAGEGEGMGTYSVSFPEHSLKLNLLPKDVHAGTYSSTISVTINSGP